MTMMSILKFSRLRTKGKKCYVLYDCTTVPSVDYAKTEKTKQNFFRYF